MKTALCLLSLCVPAYAGNCHVPQARVHRQVAANVVLVPRNFVAVGYAVPVATPSYVGYQYPQYQAHAGPDPFDVPPAKPEATNATTQGHEAPSASLVQQSCVKCHSGESPKGKLDLSGDLSPDVRLKMIGRILADDPAERMPKGKALDAQAIGLLIQELSKIH